METATIEPAAPVSGDNDQNDAGRQALRRMFRRDSLYTLGFVLQLLMGSIVTPVLARVLGTAGYGRVAACLAVGQVLFTIESLGLFVGILRIASLEGIRAGRAVLGMSLVFSAVLTAGLLATYTWWGQALGFGDAREALLITIVWCSFSGSTWVSLALLRSADNLRAVLTVDAIQIGGSQALGLVLALRSSDRVTAYLSGMAIMQGLSLFVGLIYLSPVMRLWHHRATLYRALVFSLPVLPSLLSNFVLSASDRIIIGRDLGPIAVGRYQVAYGLACVALLLVGVLSSQWLPSLLAVQSTTERQRAIASARDRLTLMLVPTVLGLSAGVPELLRFWVSPSFDTGGLTVVIVTVAASTIPFTLYSCHQLALMVEGSTRLIAIVMITSALVNVALNLVLVPRLGINGSGYATLLAYIFLWASTTIITRGSALTLRSSPRIAGAVLLAGGLAAASLLLPTTGTGGAVRWIITGGCAIALVAMAKAAGTGLSDDAPASVSAQPAIASADDPRPTTAELGVSLSGSTPVASFDQPTALKDDRPADHSSEATAGQSPVTDPEAIERIAARARSLIRVRIRAALDGAATPARQRALGFDDAELERIATTQTERVDGPLLQVAVVHAVSQELGIETEEALGHPAVDRVCELLRGESRTPHQRPLLLDAVHVFGVATLEPEDSDIELRLADVGIDVRKPSSNETIGRLRWDEIRIVAVKRPGRGLPGRRRPALLAAETDRGEVTFELPGVSDDEITTHLEPLIARNCAGYVRTM